MNRFLLSAGALAAAIGLSGCVFGSGADVLDAPTQQVEVHAILEHREVAGVGCLLANDIGRWFVVAPGRVTITRSSKPLAVHCKRDKVGSAEEWWGANYQANRLVGNILYTAGLQDYVNGNYAYQSVITVFMRPAKPGEGDTNATDPDTPVF
jgi:hypothetical protein